MAVPAVFGFGRSFAVAVTYWVASLGMGLVLNATAGAAPTSAAAPRAVGKSEEGARWRDLTAGQRNALKPLERNWQGIDAIRKRKWLEIADRFGAMVPADQARIQGRMTEWVQMTPEQRGKVRLQFQEAQRVAPQDRQAQWAAYQALPPEQRQQLAARAAAPAASAAAPRELRKGGRANAARGERSTRQAGEIKSNIVPNPGLAAPQKSVAPTVVQAGSGASTTLITRRPAPPAHQQTGLPKIAAAPGYVDASTLLPQRGPQGAATRPSTSADIPPKKP
ncbi:MAG: DUF3106 domain-containing protein [Burkholderiaceae bacterium]